MAQDFSPTAHFLVRLRVVHPTLAVLVVILLLLTAGVNAKLRPSVTTRRLAMAVAGLAVTQLAAGLVNLLLLAPIGMQLVHLLLADALWIALVLLAASSWAWSDGSASTPGARPAAG